jgi:hypothetical protein
MLTLERMVIESILDRPADLSLFEGGWSSVSVLTVGSGQLADVSALEAEVFLYVLEGTGILHLDGEDVAVKPGIAVSLALRTRAAFEAGPEGLRVFDARVRVEGSRARD